jgi:hypothetical protein
MPELEFDPHAEDQMRRRQLPDAAAYHVVSDPDDVLERPDGRTEYTGTWEGRTVWLSRREIKSPCTSSP